MPGADGRPRPPRAPEVAGPWPPDAVSGVGHPDPADLDELDGPYVAGSDREPLLEWVAVRPGGRTRFALAKAATTIAAPGVALLIAALVFAGGGLATVLAVLGVVLLVAFVVVAAWSRWRDAPLLVIHVGSRHVAQALELGSTATLDLAALDAVAVTEDRHGTPLLRMVGGGGKALTFPLGAVEANPELWDLLYVGLRHSDARGARIDEDSRRRLRLGPRSEGA